MYKLENQDYGLKLTLSGDLTESEISGMTVEFQSLVESFDQPFSILVDARRLITLDQSVFHLMIKCQQIAQDGGRRSEAIVVSSPVLKSQGQRITLESGSSDAVRFISSVKHDDWEKVAMDWILRGIEPDSEFALSK